LRVEREIKLKANWRDVVTEVDLACEQAIMGVIRAAFPTHAVLAEEGSTGGDDPHHRWVVDPLDGTSNFAQGLPWFCTSIALEIDGESAVAVIFDAVHDELYTAVLGGGAYLNDQPMHASIKTDLAEAVLVTSFAWEGTYPAAGLRTLERLLARSRGIRAMGAAALNCAAVAAGRLDAFWAYWGINAWDIAAARLLLTEAGGRVSHHDGRPYDVSRPGLLASNGPLHDALVSELSSAAGSDAVQ
jgi:myo-inositol-1(or 4)-monophosphatase